MTINQKTFFATVRRTLFDGRIGARQVEGLSAILDEGEDVDLRHLAYTLATAHHETARTMQPICERGGSVYFRRMYDITGERPQLARTNGNTRAGDGARYSGRGFVQLTWKNNYRRAGEKLGLDLVANPDLALALQPAIRILFAGMAEGWFTGKKLGDYFSTTRTDWVNARRIINGVDRASLIAGYAKLYWAALQQAAEAMPEVVTEPLPPVLQPALPPQRRARRRLRPSAALQLPPQTVPFHQMPMDPGR
ncbi:MAG: glycoside hydrolase family 19 protein [Beijerinckiaceae bacterium]